ncbi:MAG: DUF305 domain-containing protein [Hyphomonadaceae bacterium]|nr:DUF305 domain-containing protein [Hyphomonadaceae bacterium]OUX94262.1 MAG: DUF305 domain-containing protein [Hyphomonas sp. TMED17]
MINSKNKINKHLLSTVLTGLSAAVFAAGATFAQSAPIVQPGAPGEPVRQLDAQQAADIADTSYTRDDVLFMRGMIPHHQQAVDMALLAADRTNTPALIDIADRIMASQADEIEFMNAWLAERGEDLQGEHVHHMQMMADMDGMATPEQMASLAGSDSKAFDALFLALMIEHHKGALTMIEDLLDQSGSAYDPVLFEFTNDIVNDQSAEIEMMNNLLANLSVDPRAGLAPGLFDAGEAISNLEKIATLRKPAGFFDPNNPSNLPPVIIPLTDAEEASPDASEASPETQWGQRYPLLSFSNTDMAFSEDIMVVGNYHGFNIYRLSDDPVPELISSVVCPGGQGDVSIVGDLLLMSAEQTRGRVDCGRQGVAGDISSERFRGLRIFDISDPAAPYQAGQVQTCRGSHTHSVVSGPDQDGMIVVYNSGISSVRDEEELAGCVNPILGDERTALFRIDVIEILVDDPSQARLVDSPGVFADAETGQLAGLWQGGDHGDDTQRSSRTDHCHDITVFPAGQIAAGACSGNGVLFDISDPLNPKRIDDVVDQRFAYWHSATFNNDGTKVLFTDEWGGGGRPRCRPSDRLDWGTNAIYDIVDGRLELRGYFKPNAPQSDQENCTPHNGSIVPIPGRDVFVQGWYQGGVSVLDFTDSAAPFEIAYFDRGPIHEERLVVGGFWSVYWYDGRIYGTEMVRGLDVFALSESKFISANEIAASLLADQGELFNPQQQFAVSWPVGEPAIALAYIDQLERAGHIAADETEVLRAALARAGNVLDAGERDGELALLLQQAGSNMNEILSHGAGGDRMSLLTDSLSAIAARL